tara:strand:- start:442 stop:846 length:405 start_codon:yes stop_codon:yes gene_type:complete
MIYKALTYISLILSLFAVGSLIAILVDNFIGIDIMMYTAYIVLAIITLSVLVYTFKNVIDNKSSLISTLRGVGSFLMLFVILYFLSSGEEVVKGGEVVLSATGSKFIGAGLYMFYSLAIIASLSMVYFGFKNRK